VKIDEMNRANAPGAAESAAMNFEEADLTPEIGLNEILWKSVFGRNAVMPPPVHAAFIRPRDADGDDDDDDPGRVVPGPGGRTNLMRAAPRDADDDDDLPRRTQTVKPVKR